ncbi:hypothetical protein M409DRAFT_30434 [Zasmidium cellare ATCC 36951]|uniref:Beta-lactamase-related domain-containing protein n=1 Tax=Zasmidium cellare ATCC 36951 TaxID=1080233 RepID=A0A6A6BZ07_ZASCE|nr:uncharacterized protein M409DRAFT_30434 [Zasmidium cellare ATCC 36951]KAF2159150.1 hypothetical protein M409DRAFT_30434 [Zasmidium cellare ATCC 36951]
MASTQTKADLSNWREAPYNQWAFVNVDQVVGTHEIKRGPSVHQLETSERQLDEFSIQLKDKALDLPKFISASDTDGLIVLQHGKIVHEQYVRENDQKSKHIMMSMTKSVTGLLVGILQSQGKLKETDLVAKYVPEVSGSFYKDVTIRQCIDMRSGAVYPDGQHEYRCAAGWNPENGSEKYTTLHGLITHFEPELAKDDRFEYVSVNTDLMGWVIERATGKTFAEVISELLWQPLGAESDALITVDKEGSARAAGGMCATLRDIARIGQLIVEGGKGIIPSAWLDDIVNGGSKEAFAQGAWAAGFAEDFSGLAYRSHWLSDAPTDVTMALGIHGQMLFADRKNGIVVAKTGSQPDAIDFGKIKMTVLAFKEIERILLS